MRAAAWTLAVALCLALPVAAQAQDGVRGVVTEAGTGAALAGARVASSRGPGAETAGDGTFSLAAVPGDTLIVAAIGFARRQLVLGPADSLVRIALDRTKAVLPDIVVTASRREQRAAQTAVPVTSLGREEIDVAAAASVDRLLGELPGVQLLPTNPTGANLSIRGVDGPRVLVLVDGEPISGNLLENRDLGRLSSLAVDRIEVVKGPLSALYGSDALGGVVNVVTSDPVGPFELAVQGRVGDGGRREGSISTQGGGAVRYRVSGGWREDRRVASVSRPEDALERVWDLRSTVRMGSAAGFRLRTDVGLLRERQRWRLSTDGFNGFNDNTGVNGFVEAAWPVGGDLLRSRVFFEHYQHRFRQARGDRPLAADSSETQREEQAKASVIYSLGLGRHTLDLGADMSHRWIVSPGKVDGTIDDDLAELYAQSGWSLGTLLLNPAARVSWNSEWGTAFTPSLAAAWEAASALRLRAGLARGFRGPSFKELAWDFPNAFAGYTIRGNPDLVPERSWQGSAGVTWSTGRVALSADGYRNAIRDLIELTPVGTDPGTGLLVFSPRNVRRARTQGIELGARWSDARWLAAVEYGYLDATDLETGLELDRRAAHSARVRLGREVVGEGRLRTDLTLAYTGSAPAQQADGGDGRQDDLLSANAQVRWQPYADLTIGLGVDNLFDATPEGWTGLVGRRVYLGIGTTVHP